MCKRRISLWVWVVCASEVFWFSSNQHSCWQPPKGSPHVLLPLLGNCPHFTPFLSYITPSYSSKKEKNEGIVNVLYFYSVQNTNMRAHALSAHLERTPWDRPVSTLTQLWIEIAEISLDFHFRFVMVKAQPAMPVKLMPLAAHSFSWPTVANSTTKITTRVAQIIYSTEMETMIPYL